MTANRIIEGDCIAGMKKLEAGSIDLAFADPPFNIGYEYDVYDDVKEHQHYLDWTRDWMGQVVRVLKPNGLLILETPNLSVEKALASGFRSTAKQPRLAPCG